jgi:hypothetical protein
LAKRASRAASRRPAGTSDVVDSRTRREHALGDDDFAAGDRSAGGYDCAALTCPQQRGQLQLQVRHPDDSIARGTPAERIATGRWRRVKSEEFQWSPSCQ